MSMVSIDGIDHCIDFSLEVGRVGLPLNIDMQEFFSSTESKWKKHIVD